MWPGRVGVCKLSYARFRQMPLWRGLGLVRLPFRRLILGKTAVETESLKTWMVHHLFFLLSGAVRFHCLAAEVPELLRCPITLCGRKPFPSESTPPQKFMVGCFFGS